MENKLVSGTDMENWLASLAGVFHFTRGLVWAVRVPRLNVLMGGEHHPGQSLNKVIH